MYRQCAVNGRITSTCIVAQNKTTSVSSIVPRRSASSSFAPLRKTSRSIQKSVLVRASLDTKEAKPEVVKVAETIGLNPTEGLFGFKPFSELWVGRLAMGGFLVSLIEEGITGQGALGQLGFQTPSLPLLATILALFGGATLVASFRTILRATGGQMSESELLRYRSFFSMQQDVKEITETELQMKRAGDFTSPDNLAAIKDTARSGLPADKILDMSDRSAAEGQAEQMKAVQDTAKPVAVGPNMSLAARDDVYEQMSFADAQDLRYARGVEMTNGRWAMLGFLASIVVEAATGNGILGQIIFYLKAANVLGPDSGF